MTVEDAEGRTIRAGDLVDYSDVHGVQQSGRVVEVEDDTGIIEVTTMGVVPHTDFIVASCAYKLKRS